ncbi:hypothetical protein NG99_08420 [Erwinia typographi]|uniref:Uncharacterized protein n=1 Tax=Erwinia typographi TaxID=371042 RepID=A0A0A3Z6Y7_9GAMM|nr:hypothetical protein [Erwinia typographi]KGT94625.1 hypothetical protein NG99_08420 [Erwinia typographi]
MKELNSIEIMQVSGAGIIEDLFGNVGGNIGNGIFNMISNVTGGLEIEIPLLGNVSLSQIFSDFGRDAGSRIGGNVGSTIENMIGGIPVIGGFLNGLLGN